jgi:YgiT-type zinc finger domain-containing protein/excisionase family DNA binding protein
MREKKWVDCPVCGTKGSMRHKTGLKERFNPPGYMPIEIKGLDGSFCQECDDGFWSLKSKAEIARQLAEGMADQDSKRIVASEIASVKEAAALMHVTAQGIHKMMNDGRIRYVFAAGRRFPIRKDLTDKAKLQAHASSRR